MVKLIYFTKKIRSSSLLEVIVAMIIIMIVFGIAMMIFTNVTQSTLSAKRLKAEAIINKLMLQTEQNGMTEEKTIKINDFSIDILSKSTGDYLNQVKIIAYDENHVKIAQLQKLIIFRHE